MIDSNSTGWLTGKKIIEEVDSKEITISNFKTDSVNSNSYNFHLSPKILRLTNNIIDCFKPDEYEQISIPQEGLVLYPNECYLGSTVEVFGSNKYASLITGRSSIGRKFITTHITAGLIDQGFFGNITLEIIVQKPTIVYPEMSFGQIFWFTTFGPSLLYKGKYQNQEGPTASKLNQDLNNT